MLIMGLAWVVKGMRQAGCLDGFVNDVRADNTKALSLDRN